MGEQVANPTVEKYEMVFESKTGKRILNVYPEDLIENADGQLDCPIEYVLRRNQLSFADLNKLSPKRAIFIHKKGEETTVLQEIALNVNF